MTTNVQGRLCHLIVASRQEDQFDENDLTAKLRSDDVNLKRKAMKTIIRCLSCGIPMPNLFLEVINNISKHSDHYLKKLWFLFWEMMPKIDNDGQPLPEVILACDSFLKDLIHPNEFLRGSVLRFMSKVREPVVLKALFNYVIDGLKHRDVYVKRNAVLAIFSIYKKFPNIIVNVPEILSDYLVREMSMACKRNAFIALLHVDEERALNYLIQRIDSVVTFGETLQLIVVELIFKVCRRDPHLRSRFIRCVYSLLKSSSPAVRFEAANTLVMLTPLPSAIKEATKCYVDLVSTEDEVNVSLVVLSRLRDLVKSTANNKSVLGDIVVDMLRMLACNSLVVRKEVLKLVILLISQRNIAQVMMTLKNEFIKSDKSDDLADGYKKLLITAFKDCCRRFKEAGDIVLPTIVDYLSISSQSVSDEIVDMIKSVFTTSNEHSQLLSHINSLFLLIRYPNCVASITWLLCQFSTKTEQIETTFKTIIKMFAEIISATSDGDEPIESSSVADNFPKVTHVSKDGTYITQSALATTKQQEKSTCIKQSILTYIDSGYFLAVSSICSSLTKLIKRLEMTDCPKDMRNSHCAEAMLAMVSVLCYLEESSADRAEMERIESCVSILLDFPCGYESFDRQFRDSLVMSSTMCFDGLADKLNGAEPSKNTIDTAISFNLLSDFSHSSEKLVLTNESFRDISSNDVFFIKRDDDSEAAKVVQLTGMVDVVYAEARIEVNHYTIWLDVSVVNQSADTLQNFTLELSVVGDMTVINRPQSGHLPPHSTMNISTSVRLSSLKNGAIFGSLVYDTRGATSDRCYVVLNDIRIDIIDYINPAHCSDDEFRKMWSDFEWENKISVNTNISELKDMLEHVIGITKMNCLTPHSMLNYDLGFISANLYSKSIFGDSILANLNIEKNVFSSEITGHIRIRSMTQAIAVSLGDLINAHQRNST